MLERDEGDTIGTKDLGGQARVDPVAVGKTNPRARLAFAKLVSKEVQLRADTWPEIDEARWMILLDIFIAQGEGRDTPFMSAAHASNVSVSTGQRHLHRMIETGLIEPYRSELDQRVTHVRLTRQGLDLVGRMLEEIGSFRMRALGAGKAASPAD